MIVIGELNDTKMLHEMVRELTQMGVESFVYVDEKTGISYLAIGQEKDLGRAQDYYRVRLGFQKPIQVEEEWIRIKSLPRGDLTFGMIVVCVVIYGISFSNVGQAFYDLFMMGKAESGFLYEISRGQIWRLITPIFLHMNILHVLFNMLWFKDLGYLIEHRFGHQELLIFVLISALVSNLMQYLVSGPLFGGMSGVLYAMLGFVWVYKKLYPDFEFGLPKRDIAIMVGWLFLCLTGLLGPIANTAHAGGLFVGMSAAVFRGYGDKMGPGTFTFQKVKYLFIAVLILIATLIIEGVRLNGRFFALLWL